MQRSKFSSLRSMLATLYFATPLKQCFLCHGDGSIANGMSQVTSIQNIVFPVTSMTYLLHNLVGYRPLLVM